MSYDKPKIVEDTIKKITPVISVTNVHVKHIQGAPKEYTRTESKHVISRKLNHVAT